MYKRLMPKVKIVINNYINKFLEYKNPFLTLFFFYLIAFSAIIRANYTYADDIGRTFEGYHGWLDWSRWTTELLATFIHANWKLTDISPFPQILACAIMSMGGVILLYIFKEKHNITLWNIFAVSITALAPYFLRMISYKFDSPYMALGFLVSVIPFCYRKHSRIIYMSVSIICLLVMCTTYQAYSGVYPMIVLFLIVHEIRNGKNIKNNLSFFRISITSYIISLCLFWFFLMRDNGVSIFSPTTFFSGIIERYVNYFLLVFKDFSIIWILLIALIFICFVITFTQDATIKKIPAILLAMVTILTSTLLCFGAYLFISREAYDVRAMCGINVWLSLFAIYISFHAKSWLPKAIYSALVWCFFVFALTHGNALAQEQDYTDYRVQLIINDLNELDVMNTNETKKLHVEGTIGNAPVNRNMSEIYPILKRTIYNEFTEGALGQYYICNYINIPNVTPCDLKDMETNLPILKDTMFHTIKGDCNNILITLK